MTKWLKVKKSPFEKGSTRVREGEGFGFQKIPRPSGTPFYKGGLKMITVATLVIIIGSFLPLSVLALDYVPLAPLPGTTETVGGKEVVANAGNYIKGAFNLAIGIAAALAIIMIIIGGIQYMGSESLGGKSAGRKRINDAVLGLLLALGSYLILFTINPSLVDFNVNIGAITPPTSSAIPPDPSRPPIPPGKIALEWQPITYRLEVANAQYKLEYGVGLEMQPPQLFDEETICKNYDFPGVSLEDRLIIMIVNNCEKVAGSSALNQPYNAPLDCRSALLPYNSDSSKFIVKSCEREFGAKDTRYYDDNETERAKCLEAARILMVPLGKNRISILCLK